MNPFARRFPRPHIWCDSDQFERCAYIIKPAKVTRRTLAALSRRWRQISWTPPYLYILRFCRTMDLGGRHQRLKSKHKLVKWRTWGISGGKKKEEKRGGQTALTLDAGSLHLTEWQVRPVTWRITVTRWALMGSANISLVLILHLALRTPHSKTTIKLES